MLKTSKVLLSVFLIVILFGGCNSENRKLKISVNSWIGYMPIFYLKERGILTDKIEFISVVSLGESINLFKFGSVDGFTGTQYEYNSIKDIEDLSLVMLFDRSNGGDAILSNIPIDKIKSSDLKVSAYMEADSINSVLFDYFIKKHKLKNSKFDIKDQDQISISKLQPSIEPSIISTYNPYLTTLQKSGWKVISSSREKDMIIFDGLFIQSNLVADNIKTLKELKVEIDRAIEFLEENPKEFYQTVKKYMQGESYKEFLVSLSDIEWINMDNNSVLKEINNHHIDIDKIIK